MRGLHTPEISHFGGPVSSSPLFSIRPFLAFFFSSSAVHFHTVLPVDVFVADLWETKKKEGGKGGFFST